MKKSVLVTGSTDGIGKQTALQLAKLGFRVIVHGRNRKKSEKAAFEIKKLSGNNSVDYVYADLTSQTQIYTMAVQIFKQYESLDVLINNAGVYINRRNLTEDGLETTFAVNHMAPFIVTNLLLPLLKKSEKARIVTVSSMIHAGSIEFDNLQGEKYFDGGYAYSLSKLCNVLFTYKIAREIESFNITANCLHPGVINTKLLRAGWGGMGAPASSGAETSVFLASSADIIGVTGKYFANKKASKSKPITYAPETQDKLWEISEKLWRTPHEVLSQL